MDSKSDNLSSEKFPPPDEHCDAPINAQLNGTEANTADSGANTAEGCPVTTDNGPKATGGGPETTDSGLRKESLEDGDGNKTGEVVQNGVTSDVKMNVTLEDLPEDDDEDKKPCVREAERERGGEGKTIRPANAHKTTELEIEPDDNHLDPRNQKWSEALKAKLFASVDKDSNFFSYMFLDKIFGEARPCRFCGARGTAKLPPRDESLKLCVLEDGIVGRQNILCTRCGEIDTVVSCDDVKRFPTDDRLSITGAEIRAYCRNITHYEILHDLMEMLHIAATDDDSQRQEKHHEVADFMLRNVRRVCEEWCKPEYAELRLKKYLRLRDETLLTTYNPTFTPDCTEEYKEMYEMMANSFRQNRDKVLLLLQLMKESLIDSPTRSTFMMWVSIAMMHSESYSQFKTAYDPRSFMRVDSSEYQALQDRYLALEVPLGIKKIPVIFILFEIPRFYHYVEFLNQRIGKKKLRNYLTDEERATLQTIEEETLKMGLKMKPRTGKMVSPEAHLDFLTRQEEYGREMIYQSCRDKEKAKQQKMQNALKAATSVKGKHSSSGNSNNGSSSPSSSRKTESTKSTTLSFSSVASGGNSERERHNSPSLGSSEASKPIPNKKKRKKNRALNSEADTPSPSPASIEEKLKKKKVEDDTRRRREEFISDDHLKAILRETIKASASRGEDGGGEKEKKKKKKKGHAKKVQEDGDTPTKSAKEEKTTSKEDNCAKEAEKKAPQEDSKIEREKEVLKEEKDDAAKEVEVNSAADDKKDVKDAGEEEKSNKVTTEERDDTEKGDEKAGEKTEKQTKGSEDKQVPKAIKPEVNPDSPLANVSLPPRPGLDPNRKPISLPSLEPTSTPATKYTTRSSLKRELREQMKASKRHKKSGRDSTTVLCAQVDTDMLRAQGYKISGNSPVTTVVANSDGTIEHILEGLNTPEQVKAFLSRRYSILNQQAGSGYLTMPSKNDPGAIVVDPGKEINPFVNSAAAKFTDGTVEPKIAGNPKKRKKARNAQQQPTISSLMDCYAQQREQCKPGGWKAGYEQHQQEELMGGVLDEAMCGALGGGDLNKALSTAFKGAMAQAQMQGSDESGSGKGWSGMGSYRINSDGSVSEAHMYDPVDLVGSSSSSSSGSKSKTTTNDKGGSGSMRNWKGGKKSSRFRGSGSKNGRGSSKSTSSAVSTRNPSGKLVKDKYCVADPESLIAVGTMSTIGWSDAKRDLFKNHMCRGLDEKVATVDTEDEAREIFLEAMKPCDLGKLEGPCPRYVVPSSGGLGQLTGSFPLPEVGNIRDFDDFLKSPAAPRQQMTLLDAMRFPYKLETTKVYIRRKDKDGNELPPKCTMVSKVTMLPKELAERYCFVGDAGIIHELVDPADDVPSILSTDEEIKKLLEIEAPHSRDEPPPKILSSADFELDTPPDIAVESLTKVLRESIINNPKLRESPLTLQGLNDSIIGVLKDMPTAKLVDYREDFGENDSELGITLPNDITVKSLTAGDSGSVGTSSTSNSKRKKIKKKPKKPNPTTSQTPTEDTPSPSLPMHATDETPISINGQEVGVSATPPTEHANVPDSTPESVRDIDDIDDIEIGVSEDLLKGAGIGSGVATNASEDSAAKAPQSKLAAREKFRSCENCGSTIEERILVCSGCKKVAYCDRKCQKAHWKAHKKACSHRVTKEDCTG